MGNTAGLLGPFFFLHSHGEYEGRKRVELQKSNSNTVHLFQESKKKETKRVKWKGKLTPARHRCSADLAPCIHIPSLLSRTTGTLMWTWRFREVKRLAPNHTASRWWSWNSNLSPSEADPLCGRLPRSFRDRFANILIPISHPRRGPGQEGGGGNEVQVRRFKLSGMCLSPSWVSMWPGEPPPDCNQGTATRASWPKGKKRQTCKVLCLGASFSRS